MTFRNIKLADLSEVITKGTTPTTMGYDFQSKGINFYKAQDLLSRYPSDTDTKISIECHDALKRSKIRKNDILVSIAGTIGRVSIWNSRSEANCNQAIAIIRCKPDVNALFSYYALTSGDVQDQIKRMTKTTAQPNLNLQELGSILIPQPSSIEQKSIVSILSSLDDKIELNNKINNKLEELAQTLYKHWFVDFEFPNEEGLPYKSSGGKMVESELGPLPYGWEVKKIGTIIERYNKKSKADINQKLIDLSCMPSYSITLDKYDLGDKLKTNIYDMKKFNILYGSIRPYLGKFGIAPFDGISTGTIHQYTPIKSEYFSFIATLSFSKEFNDYCVKLSDGTKMPVIKWDDLCDFKIPYNYKCIKMFNDICVHNYTKIVNNANENICLKNLRDLLLPKLMSGEIRVPIEEE